MTDLRSTTRIVGVDIARFVALAGMMATHIVPAFDAGTSDLAFAHTLAGGRASALFAVLAGVSLALTTGRTTPVRGRTFGSAAVGVAVRALLIAGIGLALGRYDSGIAVILTYYAVLFVLGIPFLLLTARWLFLLAGAWLVVVPVLAQLIRRRLPERGYDNPSFRSLQDPAQLLGELTFTGAYPAVPWLAYLLVGMAIGRTDLTRWRTPAVLAVVGAVLVAASVLISDALLGRPGVKAGLAELFGGSYALERFQADGFPGSTPTDSWWWLAVRSPHTATPFDLAQTIGSAMVVIALCLALGWLLPSIAHVLFGAGAMTLTLYSVHVLLRVQVWNGESTATYVGQVLAALVTGAVFRLLRRRGPLESVVGSASRAVRRLVPV